MTAISTRLARLAAPFFERGGDASLRSGQATGALNPDLLGLLACPETKEVLRHDKETGQLVADKCGRIYQIDAGIAVLIAAAERGGGVAPAAAFGARYDGIIASPSMRALYGDSGYFNTGYWDEGTATLEHACDAMVDELARSVGTGARIILDVGCGPGAGTRRLASAFPDALTIGVNISHCQLIQARSRGVAAAIVSDAARLGIATGIVDAVVAIESPQHFDTRANFLAEAWRVLRPGGRTAIADMLFRDREPIGRWMLPEGNELADPEAYRALLSAAGFVDIEVKDVTKRTWTPFCRLMSMEHHGPPGDVEAVAASLSHYVIATAAKPRLD